MCKGLKETVVEGEDFIKELEADEPSDEDESSDEERRTFNLPKFNIVDL